MKKMYTYIVAALLIVACSLWFYHANAKVCFLANEGDCGQNASGNDLDPYEDETDIRDKCCHRTVNCSSAVPGFNAASPLGGVIGGISKVGPGLTGTKPGSGSGTIEPSHSTLSWFDTYPCKYRDDAECENVATASNPVIGDFCPYSSQYALTCPLKYQYDSACISPLVSDGRCGKKYACKCGSKYQFYMEDGKCKSDNASLSDTAYSQDKTYIAGEMCSYITGENSSVVAKTLYSRCECPATLYPYKTVEDCALATGGDPSYVDLFAGDGEFVCNSAETDNNGNVTISPSYARCRCNRKHYVKDATTCPFVPSTHCKDDTGTYVVSCCNDNPNLCNYTQDDEGKDGIGSVKKCDCFEGYKIVGCADGYKYVDGVCVKSGCMQAMDRLFDLLSGSEYAQYGIYDSENHPTNDVNKIIVADSIKVDSLDEFSGKEVMSAQQFIKSQNLDDPVKIAAQNESTQKALAEVQTYCATTVPLITENKQGNEYSGKFNFIALGLDLQGKFKPNSEFNCKNCQITARGVTFSGKTKLRISDEAHNAPNRSATDSTYNVYVRGKELNIKEGKYDSSGYIYRGSSSDKLAINVENNNLCWGDGRPDRWSFESDGEWALPVSFMGGGLNEELSVIEHTNFNLRGSAHIGTMLMKYSNIVLGVKTVDGNEYCRNMLTFSGTGGIMFDTDNEKITMCAGSAIGTAGIDEDDPNYPYTGLNTGGSSYVGENNIGNKRGIGNVVFPIKVRANRPSGCDNIGGTDQSCNWWTFANSYPSSTCIMAHYREGNSYVTKVLKDRFYVNGTETGTIIKKNTGLATSKGAYEDGGKMKICTATFKKGSLVAVPASGSIEGTINWDKVTISGCDKEDMKDLIYATSKW